MDRTCLAVNAGRETHHYAQPSCDDSRREIWSPSRTADMVRGHSDEPVLHDASSGCCLWRLGCRHHRRFSLQLKNNKITWYSTKLINNHCNEIFLWEKYEIFGSIFMFCASMLWEYKFSFWTFKSAIRLNPVCFFFFWKKNNIEKNSQWTFMCLFSLFSNSNPWPQVLHWYRIWEKCAVTLCCESSASSSKPAPHLWQM